MNKAINV